MYDPYLNIIIKEIPFNYIFDLLYRFVRLFIKIEEITREMYIESKPVLEIGDYKLIRFNGSYIILIKQIQIKDSFTCSVYVAYSFSKKALEDFTTQNVILFKYTQRDNVISNGYLTKPLYWINKELEPIINEINVWNTHKRSYNFLNKRGYCLQGSPGTGKTEFINYIGFYFKKPILNISLPKDIDNIYVYQDSIQDKILVINDIDHYFSEARPELRATLLTFIDEAKDCIIFFTCNDISKLHPTLIRSGRIDKIINMPTHISLEGKEFIVKNLLKDYPECWKEFITDEPITPADFKNKCVTELCRRLYAS